MSPTAGRRRTTQLTRAALAVLAATALTACSGTPEADGPSASPTRTFGTVSPGESGEDDGSAPGPAPSPTAKTPAQIAELDALFAESDPPAPLDTVLVNPAPLLTRVSVDRMMADVTAVAGAPREVTENPDAVRAAARRAVAAFTAAGLTPREKPVSAEGRSYPAVYTVLRGTGCTDRAILLVSHYDSVSGAPGADDNASGYAAVLELARVLAKSPLPVTVVLGVVPFEELGAPYHGSKALLSAVRTDERLTPMLGASLDMLAYPSTATPQHPHGILLQLGYADAVPHMKTIRAAATRWGGGHRIRGGLQESTSPALGLSDHQAFHHGGVPALYLTDGGPDNPHYHLPSDTPATLNRTYYAASVRMILAGVVAVASLDANGDRSADLCRAAAPAG